VKKVKWPELGCFDTQQRTEVDQLLRRWFEILCLCLEGCVMAEHLGHLWDWCLTSTQCKGTWINPLESTFLSSGPRYPKKQWGFPAFAFVYGKCSVRIETGMELWGNDTERGKPAVCGEKLLPLPLYPIKISHTQAWDRTWVTEVTGRRLSAWVLYTLLTTYKRNGFVCVARPVGKHLGHQ
jgi:hypothetical protein